MPQNWPDSFKPDVGKVWTNDRPVALWQWRCQFSNSCGRCIEMAGSIGRRWPLPLHRGCRCENVLIRPGERSAPGLDYRAEVAKLDRAQRRRVIGAGNWRLVEAGLVEWGQVVDRTRIKTLRQVIDERGLTAEQLRRAGIPAHVVKAAMEDLNTPAAQQVEARRRAIVAALAGRGLTREQIATELGGRIAGRVGVSIPSGSAPQAPRRSRAAPAGAGAPSATGPWEGPPPSLEQARDLVFARIQAAAGVAKRPPPGATLSRIAAYRKAKTDAIASALDESIDQLDRLRKVTVENQDRLLAEFNSLAKEDPGRKSLADEYRAWETVRVELLERTRRQDLVAAALRPPGANASIEFDPPPRASDMLKANLDRARGFVRSITAAESDASGKVKSHRGRAYYDDDLRTVAVSDRDAIGTVVHEIAHGIEMQGGANAIASQFLRERVAKAGMPDRPMRDFEAGYDASETGNEDGFAEAFGGDRARAAYCGKTYVGTPATEVISMGVEQLYDSPKDLLKDREYFAFVVGVLHGELR